MYYRYIYTWVRLRRGYGATMDVKKWCEEELSNKLGFTIDNEVIKYPISMPPVVYVEQ